MAIIELKSHAGIASTEGYGVLKLKSISASKSMTGGTSDIISIQIPSGVMVIGTQLRNDSIISSTGGVSYSASFNDVDLDGEICTGTALSKNTKVNKMYGFGGPSSNITSGVTDILISPNAGTLDSGTISAIVYYYELTSMTNAV